MARKIKEDAELQSLGFAESKVEGKNLYKTKAKKAKKGKKVVKAVKAKVAKPKKYAVKGSFMVGADGKVSKVSKGILKVAQGRKEKANEYTVTFLVKSKVKA